MPAMAERYVLCTKFDSVQSTEPSGGLVYSLIFLGGKVLLSMFAHSLRIHGHLCHLRVNTVQLR